MLCRSCSHDNRETASFCDQCGAALVDVCPSCGAQLRRAALFCGSCGHRVVEPSKRPPAPDPLTYTPPHLAEKILRDRAALEGERRTVTVLFADAMGFTPISERLDEEQVYDLMQGCLARMMGLSTATRAQLPSSLVTALWPCSAPPSPTRTRPAAPWPPP